MKLHRAVTLGLLLLISAALVVASIARTIPGFGPRTLLSLGVVITVAALSGIGFSWRRYFPRRR